MSSETIVLKVTVITQEGVVFNKINLSAAL